MTQPHESQPREVRSPRGTTLTARSWQTEAPMRMLMNNLDPEVAEHPEKLVVYGGTGKAARDWPSYDAIIRSLTDLRLDETLLVQSGRPVGIMRTHEWAPRVLIANSNLVGDWATWEEFRRLEAMGLTMYGQMTAGSWIYIGTQGILQGTYETFAAIAAKKYGGTLAGTITVTAGPRRDGRRAAAGGHDERRRLHLHRVRRHADQAPDRAPLPRRAGGLADACGRARRRGARRQEALVHRGSGQRGRDAARAADDGCADRHRHRPDLGARPADVPAGRRRVRRLGDAAREGRGRLHRPGARVDGPALRGDGRLPGRRRRGLRLRQLAARGGEARRLRARLRLPGLRAGVHPAAVL